jgi:hypothetical protein
VQFDDATSAFPWWLAGWEQWPLAGEPAEHDLAFGVGDGEPLFRAPVLLGHGPPGGLGQHIVEPGEFGADSVERVGVSGTRNTT